MATEFPCKAIVLPASHARKGRRHQFVFLNGRPVEDAVISRALAEGFRGAISDGLYPAAWLWIDLEPTLGGCERASGEARGAVPSAGRCAGCDSGGGGGRLAAAGSGGTGAGRAAVVGSRFAGDAVEIAPVAREFPSPAADARGLGGKPEVAAAPMASRPRRCNRRRSAGFPDDRDVAPSVCRVWKAGTGWCFSIPKAARERIFYEKLLPSGTGVLETQGLLVPVLLELDPRDLDLGAARADGAGGRGHRGGGIRRKHAANPEFSRLPAGGGSAAVSRGADG